METVRQLLLIYVGIMVINLVLSGVFWLRYRTKLHRALFLVWGTAISASIAQSFPVTTPLAMSLTLAPSFLIGLALADLIGRVGGLQVPARIYWIVLALGIGGALSASFLAVPFWVVALPVAAAVAFPLLDMPVRGFLRAGAQLRMPGKAAALSCFAYGLHMLDFPFLRDKPSTAVVGFSIALLITFAISITAPATVLEKVAEERTKIDELNRFQRQFFANITHELRSPLTMILAPIETMLAGDCGPLTSTQRSYLEANHRNAIRLLKLINDLLDLAKMEEGFLRLRPEHADLKALLDEVVGYARPLAARKNLKLELVIDTVPKNLHIDVDRIERVLVNLISNALKFTSQGGVTISLHSANGQVTMAVTDTGAGIKPEALPRIFERFNQGDGTVTRRYGGTGIGLAYAKEIVELHGGSITVESTPGKGSRFEVHLREGEDAVPLAVRDRRVGRAASEDTDLRRVDDQEPREWAQRLQKQDDYRFAEIGDVTDRRVISRSTVSASSARLLLVEDNPEILELVNIQLREKYAIYAATNGKQGLELARRERPDLIVTDYMMPEMDGLSMLQALRADPQFAETPIIMLTSKNQLEDRLAAREAGADVYLNKPFSPRELEVAIQNQLEKRGRHVHNLMRAHVEGLEIVSAGLAHEIQNPLNFIKGGQLLIGEQVAKIREQIAAAALTDPARVAAIDRAKQKIDRMIETAARGVSRIEGVVTLLRRYAREGYPTEPSDVVLDDAVREVTELVAPKGDVECTVSLDLQAEDHTVRFIPEELNQVIRSLVQNAMEAVGNEGTVKARTRKDGKQVVLEVSDNGPGIAPDAVAKIFSPFFTTKPGTGRGLGLAIVQIVVSRAGGTVEVSSVPSVETIFRVRLPISDGKAADSPTRTRSASQPTVTAQA